MGARRIAAGLGALALGAAVGSCTPAPPPVSGWQNELVSVNHAGDGAGHWGSGQASISADGSKVAFSSSARDLVATDTNNEGDVFVRDLATGVTSLVSVRADGRDSAGGQSLSPVVSEDGTKVAFVTTAADLGPDDANGKLDIYVRDLAAGTTSLVSTNAIGGSANGDSFDPQFSLDGTKVSFQSRANDFGPTDTNGRSDVYVRDLATSATAMVSTNADGSDSSSGGSTGGYFDAAGTKVLFFSTGNNLGANDTNMCPFSPADPPTPCSDLYVRDLNAATTTLVSVNAAGTDSGNAGSSWGTISADGTTVAFSSGASDLVANDDSGREDIFVRDLVAGTTTLVSVNASGTGGGNQPSTYPVLDLGGRTVTFQSGASNLGPTDTNGSTDIYQRDLATGATVLVSATADGTDSADGYSDYQTAVSEGGSLVVFASEADDFGPVDTNGQLDLYVRDLKAGRTTLVTANGAGTDSAAGWIQYPRPEFAAGSRRLVYVTAGSDLGPADANDSPDVYLATPRVPATG